MYRQLDFSLTPVISLYFVLLVVVSATRLLNYLQRELGTRWIPQSLGKFIREELTLKEKISHWITPESLDSQQPPAATQKKYT
jgi:hypothetical protein